MTMEIPIEKMTSHQIGRQLRFNRKQAKRTLVHTNLIAEMALIGEATNKEEALAAFIHNNNKQKFFLLGKIGGAALLSWVGGITAGAEFLKTAFLG